MLKACPKIHCNCPQLNFNLNPMFSLTKINRNLNNKVQTPISACLRIFNIILLLNKLYVRLLK